MQVREIVKRLSQFKYFGMKIIDQGKIKRRLTSGNACYNLMNLLSSRLLSRNVNIRIYTTIILTVVL
jgi:hypothetical protein